MLKAELQNINHNEDKPATLEIEVNGDFFPELIWWRGFVYMFRKEDFSCNPERLTVGIYTPVMSSGIVNFYPNETGPLWTT